MRYYFTLTFLGLMLVPLLVSAQTSGRLSTVPPTAAQITLKGVTLVENVNTINHIMTVRSTGTATTDFLVTYIPLRSDTTSSGKTITVGTKISGNPRDIRPYVDWRNNDPLNITGTVVGYENGKLKIEASNIEYRLKGVATKTIVGQVENKNAANNQISVAVKPAKFYTSIQINNINQPNGPALIGASNINSIALGSAVKLVQVWRPDPTTGVPMKLKDLSVTIQAPLPATAVVWVMRIVKDQAGALAVTSGFTHPLTMTAGNKIALQNETDKIVYLKVPNSERDNFVPALTLGYVYVNPGAIYTMGTKIGLSTGVFSPPVTNLRTVTVTKTGNGTITSLPTGINCGSACGAKFADGASVTLTAVASTGSAFTGWSGACSGTSTCTITLDTDKSVRATFGYIVPSHNLSITKVGNGTITSTPSGINCGTQCSSSFNQGTTITLTAVPRADSQFNGWHGACSGANTSCSVTMNTAKNVTATFSPLSPEPLP